MSLFDRQIDIILLSHPQEDHLGGVQEVFKRYKVKQFIRSPAVNTTEGFQLIEKLIAEKHIPQDIAEAGETITVDAVHFSVLWPDIPKAVAEQCGALPLYGCNNVLGVADVNDASVVLRLRYGTFDVLFPGDADGHVDPELTIHPLYLPDAVEVLKVPHHGSKTGMTDGFLRWLGPIKLAVISVGKNTYGHPSQETITRLDMLGTQVVRTDQKGDIEIISDGTHWEMLTEKR